MDASRSQDSSNRKDAYARAILVIDLEKLAERIAEAKAAIATRARELFVMPADHIEEEQALDDSLFFHSESGTDSGGI